MLVVRWTFHQTNTAIYRRYIMTRVKKLALAALTALALTAGVVAATPAVKLAGDPSQWGIENVAKKGSFDITESSVDEIARKVNEYEGQHIAETGDPSQWG
jgi:hypothetical protein